MGKEGNQVANNLLLRTIQTGDLIKILEIVLENPLAHINRVDFLSKIYGVSESDIRNRNVSVSLKKKNYLLNSVSVKI